MLGADDLRAFRAEGLHLSAAARVAGVSRQSVVRAERRCGVVLTRRQPGWILRIDHREAVQDMKPMEAVEYLLDVLESIIAPVDLETAWAWPGQHMTPQEKRALRVLALARLPVSRETLFAALNADRAGAPMEGDGKIVDVVLCRVRGKVAAAGVVLVNHRGVGWTVTAPAGFVWPWDVPE